MKFTIPEGAKTQVVHAICKFVNFNDEGIVETGPEFTFDNGKATVTGLKAVIEAVLKSNKNTAGLLGGSAADKQLVSDVLDMVEEVINGTLVDKVFIIKLSNMLQNQTFVALPNTLSVADFACFYITSFTFGTFKGYNGFVNVVRWYSYMQDTYASVCNELSIPRIEFNYDAINIKVPPPRVMESKKAPKKATKEEAPKEKAAAPVEEDADAISKLDIRVGRIVRAWNHPDSDKLFCEEVDVGEDQPRQIGSGIRAFHTFEEMQGHMVCVLCNLKPRKLGGFPSNGMLMCASTEDHASGALIDPPEGAKIGERVTFAGFEGEPATPAQVQKKKYLEAVLPFLKTNEEGVCCFKDTPFMTSAGVVTCKKFPNQHISSCFCCKQTHTFIGG